MTHTPDEIKKGLECLDKMQFFMGQRAGRELWNEKPHDVQEQDLEQYNRDAEKVRALIKQLQAENAEQAKKIRRLETENCKLSNRIDLLRSERYNSYGHAGPGIRDNY